VEDRGAGEKRGSGSDSGGFDEASTGNFSHDDGLVRGCLPGAGMGDDRARAGGFVLITSRKGTLFLVVLQPLPQTKTQKIFAGFAGNRGSGAHSIDEGGLVLWSGGEEKPMNLTIEFVDGSRESFRFKKRADADIKAVSRLEKIAGVQMLMLSLEGETRIYPLNNIKSVRVSPVPPNAPVPDYAIVGVEPIG
jgi:hypothetical protein